MVKNLILQSETVSEQHGKIKCVAGYG